jgi:hypothetical protein
MFTGWILVFLSLYALSNASFTILPLGVSGGDEENLPSFAVASSKDPTNFVSLDSGIFISSSIIFRLNQRLVLIPRDSPVGSAGDQHEGFSQAN